MTWYKSYTDNATSFTYDSTITNIEIDLNGQTLTVPNINLTVKDYKLTISDSSDEKTGMLKSTYAKVQFFYLVGNGELVINGGTIYSTNIDAIILRENAKLTVNGGTVKSDAGYAIVSNGTYNVTMTINDGTFISNSGNTAAIYKPDMGTLTIEKGTFTGPSALVIKGGNTVIKGGTFTATGEASEPESATESGYSPTGDAIYIEDSYDSDHNVTVVIKDGTFTSDNGYALASRFSNTAEGCVGAAVTIEGGQFKGEKGAVYGSEDFTGTYQLSAGHYSDKPLASYIVEGKYAVDDSEAYKALGYNYTIADIPPVAPVVVNTDEDISDNSTTKGEAQAADITTVAEDISGNTSTTAEGATNIQTVVTEAASGTDLAKKSELKIVLESLEINKQTVEATATITTNSAKYDVKPVFIITEEGGENTRTEVITNERLAQILGENEYISFRLAVPTTMTGDYVWVSHYEDNATTPDSTKLYQVQGSGENRYVELQARSFSVYELKEQSSASSVVSVQSRISGKDTPVANVTGGGTIAAGQQTTVTATSNVSGYTFLGWYEGYTASSNGTQVSTSVSYTFTPTGDVTLTAVYQKVSGSIGKLTVDGSKYTITGKSATQKGYHTYDYNIDTPITLTFTDTNYTFKYWANDSEKVVSREATYTFNLTCNTSLHAVYVENSAGTETTIAFLSYYEQLLSAQTYQSGDSLVFPAGPSRLGYTFKGWSLDGENLTTEAEILGKVGAETYVEVKPLYEDNNSKYSITVKYEGYEKADTVNSNLTSGNAYMITASETLGEGESAVHFQYWKDSNEKVLSKSTSVTICSVSDVIITAVYGTGTVDEEEVVYVSGAQRSMNGNYYKLSFTEGFTLLGSDTLVLTGFVKTNEASQATEESLVLDGNGITTYKSNLSGTTTSGTFTQHINTSNADKVYYMRAFVQYKDSSGTIHTLYSGIVSASYNSLTG